MTRKSPLVLQSALTFAVLATLTRTCRPASATITGFGDGSNFTTTGYTQDGSGNIVDTNSPHH